jgi:DNA polymerase III delta prime subunit
MHAFLIAGKEEVEIKKEINQLAKKLKARLLEFPLKKISDVRDLNSFTKLTIDHKTAILIKDIDSATIPALNAFLKNLEEPQENIIYILTTNSTNNLPPTITSRCQIIKIQKSKFKSQNSNTAKKFLKMSTAEKLSRVAKIKKRDEALLFIEEFILGSHSLLHSIKQGHSSLSRSIESATSCLNNLKLNGNVQLQLINFILSLV